MMSNATTRILAKYKSGIMMVSYVNAGGRIFIRLDLNSSRRFFCFPFPLLDIYEATVVAVSVSPL